MLPGRIVREMMTEILLILLLALLMIGLAFIVLVDRYISKEHRKVMLMIVALILSLIACDWPSYRLYVDGGRVFIRTLLAVYAYSIRPALLVLFGYIVTRRRKVKPAWILVGINALVHMTAFFSDICFTIDPVLGYFRGPLGFTSHVISALLLAQLTWLSLSEYRDVTRLEQNISLSNLILIVAAVAIDSFVIRYAVPVSCLDVSMVLCALFYYIWLHLQFVREHERALMADQRMQVMLSQIQPHFLYNTLAVIQNLCHTDPPQAEAATVRFARYLRGNMDSLLSEGTIPFERELEHTREYLELEKMRFRGKLEVRLEIECTDFELPPLTLQPIAENAVRHGVRGNPDGSGTVVITAREYPDRYKITVTDNGAGFDTSSAPESEERTHIGIQNVRQRLAALCRGTLELQSSVGEGTTAVITLPKEANAE